MSHDFSDEVGQRALGGIVRDLGPFSTLKEQIPAVANSAPDQHGKKSSARDPSLLAEVLATFPLADCVVMVHKGHLSAIFEVQVAIDQELPIELAVSIPSIIAGIVI